MAQERTSMCLFGRAWHVLRGSSSPRGCTCDDARAWVVDRLAAGATKDRVVACDATVVSVFTELPRSAVLVHASANSLRGLNRVYSWRTQVN
jgi:hypothetical protein